MELDESDVRVKTKSGIWTKHHEKAAIEYLQENIEQINEILDEETDEKQSSTLIKILHKMEKELLRKGLKTRIGLGKIQILQRTIE
ncbi:hypothetical protein AWH56_018850 [Anaerobacillus isosaccharinicus]|nr:hypothetical protein [Anaerobacillus isosaccharinicus]